MICILSWPSIIHSSLQVVCQLQICPFQQPPDKPDMGPLLSARAACCSTIDEWPEWNVCDGRSSSWGPTVAEPHAAGAQACLLWLDQPSSPDARLYNWQINTNETNSQSGKSSFCGVWFLADAWEADCSRRTKEARLGRRTRPGRLPRTTCYAPLCWSLAPTGASSRTSSLPHSLPRASIGELMSAKPGSRAFRMCVHPQPPFLAHQAHNH